MTLGIVYHMPCWIAADGTLREAEGSFARYVDSLAPYFDAISLCVPVPSRPPAAGTRIRARNVSLAPLPPFDGPVQFYPQLPSMLRRIGRWVKSIDVLHCRIPTPAAIAAFAAARRVGRPSFVLVVGDLRALLPSMPYRGVKRLLWRAYTAFEERNVQRMVDRSLAFANGAALVRKHGGHTPVVETTTTTISERDISERRDTCAGPTIRLLTVSRIDPRKGLRVLPAAIRRLVDVGLDVTLDIVGPAVGRPGEHEQRSIIEECGRLDVAGRITFHGAVPLDDLLPMYASFDAFVLPTLPGEGIPRVLLEAMAGGLPVVTSRVSGIPSLIAHERNGLLLDDPTADAVAVAVSRIVRDADLRRSLIANGYTTARQHTLDATAARMMDVLSRELHVSLRQPAPAPAG